ncbi:MAG TPA: hypothetical protein VNV66_12795 [Pilimelia sp.]|nr:hypothetical protein [Pilimelia sp.]
MTASADSADSAAARRRWRRACLVAALLCLVVLAASALPWFSQTRVFASGGSDTDLINIWTDGPAASGRGRTGLAQLAGTGQWGLLVMVCAGLGALLGLYARAHHPADPRLRAALRLNLGAAALGPVFVAAAWVGAAQGERVSATPHVGYLLTVPALLAWLVLAVGAWRASRARPASPSRPGVAS